MRLVIIALVAGMGLAACETVQGARRDIQKAGQALEKSTE